MSGGRTCAEVAVVVDAGLGGSPGPEVIRAVRVLQQLRHQFDVVGAEAPLDGYQVRESGRFRRAPIGRGGGERQLRVPPVDRRVAPTPPSSAPLCQAEFLSALLPSTTHIPICVASIAGSPSPLPLSSYGGEWRTAWPVDGGRELS